MLKISDGGFLMEHKVVSNHILVTEIDRLVNEGTQVSFVPKGNSMLPFIRGGLDSVVLMKDADVAPLDIVLAKVGKTYVIHRIIKIDGDRITLMGDGNIRGTFSHYDELPARRSSRGNALSSHLFCRYARHYDV